MDAWRNTRLTLSAASLRTAHLCNLNDAKDLPAFDDY